jgi:cytochrome c oxidase cbb3-type subunit 4
MHEYLTRFAQIGGTFYMIAIFAVACAYALWPKNRDTFNRAARAPLEQDDDAEPN